MGHGLGLGRIPFSKSHSPYTPVERRRRGNRLVTVGPLKLKAVRSDLPSERQSGFERNEASILPDDLSPVELTFLISGDQQRMQNSLAVSFASHISVVLLIVFLIGLAPAREYEVVETVAENYTGIIWIPEEGRGGGGGGGGNESLDVPQVVEVEGADETDLDIPIEERPELVEPEAEPEERDEIVSQALSISALTAASRASFSSF